MVCFSVAIAGHDGPMRALPETALVTVGYEGRTAEELVSAVAEAGVDVLADVRLTPLSRKPGLSKRRLAAALAGAGIKYVHLPALGNPQDNREAFRRGDPASRARFQGLLARHPPSRLWLSSGLVLSTSGSRCCASSVMRTAATGDWWPSTSSVTTRGWPSAIYERKGGRATRPGSSHVVDQLGLLGGGKRPLGAGVEVHQGRGAD